jgi:hypothetical protein
MRLFSIYWPSALPCRVSFEQIRDSARLLIDDLVPAVGDHLD